MSLKDRLDRELVWERCEYEDWVKSRWNKYRFMVLVRVAWILNGITVFADILYLFWGRQNVWLSLLCLMCFVAYLVLSSVFPAYFTLTTRKSDPDGPQISAGIPLVLHMLVLSSITLRDFVIIGRGFFVAMILITLLISAVMFCFVPEVRVRGYGWVLALLLLVCSYGVVGQVNYVTDFSQPRRYMTEVTDVEFRTGRHASVFDRYSFEVLLEDGSIGQFYASAYQGYKLYAGKDIVIYYCQGGLGLEYVRIGGIYDDLQPIK